MYGPGLRKQVVVVVVEVVVVVVVVVIVAVSAKVVLSVAAVLGALPRLMAQRRKPARKRPLGNQQKQDTSTLR
jgi:hypothetical protein